MKKHGGKNGGVGWRLNCFFTYIGFTRVSVTLVLLKLGTKSKANMEEMWRKKLSD
jgi:hypothetical protein